MQITLPHKWDPRPYQLPLWEYLEGGGKRAVALWHRRAGKDEVCLHWAAVAAHMRVATYWHMLPEATQARKAIWEAVNPHTGLRRIDEAFPRELRAATRENEMLIKFKNGSTWQVVGSDNFNSLVGSPPAGVVFSEWSLANSSAWGYMRPILAENGGWALFIYTPRGKNHGYSTYNTAKSEPDWFCQKLTVDDTNALSSHVLAGELREMQKEHGETAGRSFYQQEYYCSFEAAILGSVYGEWMLSADKEGRITTVLYDPEMDVHTAWDFGFGDATAIWFYQVIKNEIHIIDYYENNGMDVPHYCEVLFRKGYQYGNHWVPHDGNNKLLAAGGRSIIQIAWGEGVKMRAIPSTTYSNQHEAGRATLPYCWFDEVACEKGVEHLKNYQYKYDDKMKNFSRTPLHDKASHAADAFSILSRVWREEKDLEKQSSNPYSSEMTLDESIKYYGNKQKPPGYYERI